MDPISHRRRGSSGSKKLLQDDCNLGFHDRSIEDTLVDQMHNHSRSPCNGAKPGLKDVYNGLVTSKELLKVMSRICHVDVQSSMAISLFSALKLELDRASTSIGKLIIDQKSSGSDLELVLDRFEKEKAAWKMREQDRICATMKSIVEELNTEKKLRRQTEGLNKRLGSELADTKAALLKISKELENEKRTRDIMEQVCDELTRVLGEDREQVEEMKKQSEQVRDELEKEREMLELANVLREERLHMKLSEAKYEYEEKIKELESISRNNGQHAQYEEIKELHKYLRETLPVYGQDGDNDSNIELNIMEDMSKRFQWKEPEKNVEDDEMERYNMIKDLRDHRIIIASGQQTISSQDANFS